MINPQVIIDVHGRYTHQCHNENCNHSWLLEPKPDMRLPQPTDGKGNLLFPFGRKRNHCYCGTPLYKDLPKEATA